ncbi:MAG: biotin/lipoyl-binding protein [Clostridiales bacterium]|nr:biotin/lipoyl-binding protein [Clostridiales bacterium]
MKKYNVTINGKSYLVELEEVKDGTAPAPRPASPAPAAVTAPKPAAPAPAPAPKPAPAPAAAPVKAGAKTVNAPMPGTILSVKVNPGDSVKRGDVLLILEAMKMENEIMAADDGVVKSVHTIAGTSVNTGDPMISME